MASNCRFGFQFSVFFVFALSMAIAASARAEKVVMIGDSITCGPFGERMLKNLERGGKNQVTQYCMIGSAPNHWIKGIRSGKSASLVCQTRSSAAPALKPCASVSPKFEQLLSANPGSRVVIALGTNSSVGPHADPFYSQMSEMVQRSNRKCDWILPPHMNAAQSKGWAPGHVAKMESNLKTLIPEITARVSNGKTSSCKAISSFAATAAGTPGRGTTDGVHRTKDAGYYWADEISEKLLSDSAAPARSEPTRSKTSK